MGLPRAKSKQTRETREFAERREAAAKAELQESAVDVRAREVEQQMTDDERFSLLVSVAGSSTVAPAKDKRFPNDVTMCTSYTPGLPGLGVPAMLMSDSSTC
jgi:beta-glucosidase